MSGVFFETQRKTIVGVSGTNKPKFKERGVLSGYAWSLVKVIGNVTVGSHCITYNFLLAFLIVSLTR